MERPIEIIAILLNFLGSFKYGGIKYKNTIPPKAPKLPRPVTKVSKRPLTLDFFKNYTYNKYEDWV